MPYLVTGRLRWRDKNFPRGTVLEDDALPRHKARALEFAGRLRYVVERGVSVTAAEANKVSDLNAADIIDGLRSGELDPDVVELAEQSRGRKARQTVLRAIDEARERGASEAVEASPDDEDSAA